MRGRERVEGEGSRVMVTVMVIIEGASIFFLTFPNVDLEEFIPYL